MLAGFKKRGFVRVIETDGRPQRVVITSEGMAAIGVEPEDDDAGDVTTPAEADTGATAAHDAPAGDTPAPAAEGDGGAASAKRKAKTAKPGKAAPVEKPTPRTGTKQALMIEMLRRPEGATVEQIAAATGWQKHTSGAPSPARSRRSWGSPSRPRAPARSGPTRPAPRQ